MHRHFGLYESHNVARIVAALHNVRNIAPFYCASLKFGDVISGELDGLALEKTLENRKCHAGS